MGLAQLVDDDLAPGGTALIVIDDTAHLPPRDLDGVVKAGRAR
ncbi:hypothetical protein [Natronococcus wangiae]|nr:hypothetical protein [Natronococcus sp. AD5]